MMEDSVAKTDKTAGAADAAPPAAPPADGPLEALESAVAPPSAGGAATLAGATAGAAEASAAARAAAIDTVLGSWLRQHIHSSPLSRDTVAWNHLRAKLPALRDALMEI